MTQRQRKLNNEESDNMYSSQIRKNDVSGHVECARCEIPEGH